MPTEAKAPATIIHHLRRLGDGPRERADPIFHAHELEGEAWARLTDPVYRETFRAAPTP